jgi:hypothetical protein
MQSGSIRFMLGDGEALIVPERDLRPVYERLWELASEPGAISTAALLMDASRQSELSRTTIALTPPQGAVLAKALKQLRASA